MHENEMIRVAPLDTADELMDVLARRSDVWQPRPTEWIFRGQADMRWGLAPAAFRNDTRFAYGARAPFAPEQTHAAQVQLESSLIRLFVLGMDEQGLEFPSESAYKATEWSFIAGQVAEATAQGGIWPPDGLQPLFALAQHYGVPTRLLDWTHRPLTAGYFAAERAAARLKNGADPDERFSVWAYNHRAGQECGLWDDTRVFPILVRVPRARNANLHAQGGVFVLVVNRAPDPEGGAILPDLREPVASRSANARRHPDVSPVLYRFDVPLAQAGVLLRHLHYEAVSAVYLFPGVDGVVKGIQERSLWDRVEFPWNSDDRSLPQ